MSYRLKDDIGEEKYCSQWEMEAMTGDFKSGRIPPGNARFRKIC